MAPSRWRRRCPRPSTACGWAPCCAASGRPTPWPTRSARCASCPSALYELGVAVVVALSIAPQLIESGQRVRRARQLRADHAGGLRPLRSIVIPVVEDAFERSLRARSRDGLARVRPQRDRHRRQSPGHRRCCCWPGCSGCASGRYGLLDPTLPRLLGVPTLLLASALCVAALAIGGRRVRTTSYRPDPWRLPEWVVACLGLGAALVVAVSLTYAPDQLNPSFSPLSWPQLPVVPAAAILLAGLAGVVAPPPPRHRRSASVGTGRAARPRRRTGGRRARCLRGGPMIVFDHVSVTYPGGRRPVLRDVTLTLEEGELCLVVGRTGVGKSTLLGAIDGLVPHFTGGVLDGRVLVDGRDTATHRPKELADLVGVVGQDPSAGFVTDTVEEELAYGMEQMAVPAGRHAQAGRGDAGPDRVWPTCGTRRCTRSPAASSSASRSARCSPRTRRCCVLDEPTSSLDPTAAEEVLATITRLVHDLGVTVVLAEHRLERVAAVRRPGARDPGRRLRRRRHPGRRAGGRRRRPAGRGAGPVGRVATAAAVACATPAGRPPRCGTGSRWSPRRRARSLRTTATARVRSVVVRYGDLVAVREVSLDLHAGETVALMGRNGAGKSSLLWAVQGSGPRHGGSVEVAGQDPRDLPAGARRALVGLVPQNPTDLLYLETVDDELAQADRESQSSAGSARRLLDRLTPGIDGGVHPRDLSEGQRLALVLAVQLSAAPRVVLLDEPTRGLDYRGQGRPARDAGGPGRRRSLRRGLHPRRGVRRGVLHRVVVMAEGSVVADGPAAVILAGSPAFAPQVAKVLAPLPYLTVAEVRLALDGVAS